MLIAFWVTNGSETSELWRRKEFLLLCIRKACMLRYCALSRSLVKILRQDTSLAHFSKTLRSLCLILSWRAVVKSKNKFHNNLRQGLLFRYVYFLFSIFHSNRPKMRGKESRVLKKPIIFCAEELIHTMGNKWDHNKALLKIWRESDKRAILFFQTKKRTWEELDKFKCLEAKCREKPWKVRARTYGTKSPSRSEALRFIDSAKSPSTNRWFIGEF